MAPKGGTVRKEGNITYIYDNMGKKYDITSPEGKKLKKFAEKKMRDGRPTHVSSMFLCQVGGAGWLGGRAGRDWG
jgi:hypothetical protein